MNVVYMDRFLKHFDKRIKPNVSYKNKFEDRLLTFKENRTNILLKDHALSGIFKGYRAFSITGDIRVIYRIAEETIYFLDIGTHNQVYK